MTELSTPTTDKLLTPQTVQAGLASILAALANLFFPGKAAQAVGIIAPLATLIIVWAANRWLSQDEADRKAEASTRRLKKVLAETEERINLENADSSVRKQLQKQAAGLREAIYQLEIRGTEPPQLPSQA